MDNALKGLLLSAGVILTCMVIGIGFYIAREATSTAAAAQNQLSEYRKEIAESGLTKYEGMQVNGSDVINLTRKLLSKYSSTEIAPVTVNIKTTDHQETYVNNVYLKNIRDFRDRRYVNPVGLFTGSIERDENDVIVSVVFEQD